MGFFNFLKHQNQFSAESETKDEFEPIYRKVRKSPYNFKTPITKIDFVALDVETATSKGGICQIGIVEVRGGEITNEKTYLIRPPGNEYELKNIRIHGISPEMTEDCHILPDFWNEILAIIKDTVLVGHNISFDINNLDKECHRYGLSPLDFARSECTCYLHGRAKLIDVCDHYGIDIISHHDALADARAAALCYLSYLKAGIKTPEIEKKKRPKVMYENLSLSHDVKIKDLDCVANADTIFYDKRVVVTGIFSRYPKRENLALLLKSYGADINTSISKKTDIVVVGSACGPAKLNKVSELNNSGCNIRIINEEDLYKTLDNI